VPSFNTFIKSVQSLRHKPKFDQSFVLVEESANLAEQAEPSTEKNAVMERFKSLQEFYRLLDNVVEAARALGPSQLKAMVEMVKLLNNNSSNRPKTPE